MIPRSHLHSRRSQFLALVAAAALAPALILTIADAAGAASKSPGAGAGNWSASVAPALPSCPTATLCTFQNANFNQNTPGSRWNFAYSSRPHGVWFFVGAAANNKISSIYNHRAWTSYFSEFCRADNNWESMPGGSAISNLNDGQHPWPDGHSGNDSISGIGLGTNAGISDPAHSTSC